MADRATKIRVLVVDDHRVVARALELMLGREADFEVVGAAGTVEDAVRRALEERPDVVLCDFHLPDGTGADVARRVLGELPETKVVILSADSGDEAMLAAVDVGVVGYIDKTLDVPEIAQNVRQAAEGEVLIPRDTLMRLLARQRRIQAEKAERERVAQMLTERELEVLELMAAGNDSKDIARRLQIRLATARWYVQQVIEKLESHSRLEAVARAATLGLVDRRQR
jgi:DNA-binding NarL/FixJ family response regulator